MPVSKRWSATPSTEVEGLLSKYILTLYVTGTSPRTKIAIDNLNRICGQELDGRYELEIVDVLENPQRAEDEKILATPTLIKQLPPPLRRVIPHESPNSTALPTLPRTIEYSSGMCRLMILEPRASMSRIP